jgi:CheY-like chemotaxis protein
VKGIYSDMSRFLILSVGTSPQLLKARTQALSSAGYTVLNRLSVRDAIKEFIFGDFDAVILCHSIPVKEKQYFASRIHSMRPFTPVLVISADAAESDRSAGTIVINKSDSESLLRELGESLRKSVERARTFRETA